MNTPFYKAQKNWQKTDGRFFSIEELLSPSENSNISTNKDKNSSEAFHFFKNRSTVSKSVVVDKEQNLYLSDYIEIENDKDFYFLEITISKGIKVKIFDDFFKKNNGDIKFSFRLNIEKESEAEVFHYLKESNEANWKVYHTHIELAQDAKLKQVWLNLFSKNSRLDQTVVLKEKNATADFYGLMAACESSRQSHLLQVIHQAPETFSNHQIKGLVSGKAKVSMTGRIVIEKAAELSEAELLNKNILLNSGANIYSKPELLIHTDDVKCAHGSTTGSINPEEIFYLRSRGLSKQRAETLSLLAVSNEIVSQWDNDFHKDNIKKDLEQFHSELRVGDSQK